MEKVSNLVPADEKVVCDTVSDSAAVHSMQRGDKTSIIDNELLIRLAFESDPRSGCELLYRHYYQGLCSHATRFVYSRSMAEDIVSDVFCQFYIKGTFKEISSSYRAFLYKSVRNKAYDHLRLEAKRAVELNQIYESEPDATSQQPDSILQYEELCHEVESAINSLPAKCRKIYLMHRFEDKKYSEIAEELQLSPRTVEVQIRKASQFVKKALSKIWVFLLLFDFFC